MNLAAVPVDANSAALAEEDAQFLQGVGSRVRELRERSDMPRRLLAQRANVSERYLGQLETGEGNISIMLLRRVASALNVRIGELLDSEQQAIEQRLIKRFLEHVPSHRLEDVLVRLAREVNAEREQRRGRIALIGLRGAGKSALGQTLAADQGVPFIEMDREIEQEAGLPLSELFSLYGQAGYRRFERRCLERVIKDYPQAVLSVGGGVVTESSTFELLLANCFTVWLKAKPEEHMGRVVAQGDLRPMAGSKEAMEDLRRILLTREPLYMKADASVDTSGVSLETASARLRDVIARA